MEITITIRVPELVEAINNLADALIELNPDNITYRPGPVNPYEDSESVSDDEESGADEQ